MPDIGASKYGLLLPSAELNLGSTSTSEKQFLLSAATAGVAAGQPLVCPLPGSNVLKQSRPFRIRAAGRGAAAAGNLTIAMYFGNSTTITAGNKIATTGALSIATVGTWFLEAQCTWDSVSQSINGVFWGYVRGGTAVGPTTLSNIQTAVDLSVEPNLTTAALTTNCIHLTGTFGTGAAANTAFVDVFEVIVE